VNNESEGNRALSGGVDCIRVPIVANELVQLARYCRDATEVHERLRFAEEIVARVEPMLRSFVAAHCPEAAVDDVLQEVLIAIATRAHTFKGGTDSQFWGWCYRTASHKWIDHLRRASARPTVSLEVEEIRRAVEATTPDSPLTPGDRLDLEQALKMLRRSKPPCVGYLMLHFVEGMDYREIAGLYQSTANAVRMQIKRCLILAQQLSAEKG
jgi:RNA polymerase sigma factor (sigma-70 family)